MVPPVFLGFSIIAVNIKHINEGVENTLTKRLLFAKSSDTRSCETPDSRNFQTPAILFKTPNDSGIFLLPYNSL